MNRQIRLLEKLASYSEEKRTKERWNEPPPYRVVSRSLKTALSCWETRHEADCDRAEWKECGIPCDDLEVVYTDCCQEGGDCCWRRGNALRIAPQHEMKRWFKILDQLGYLKDEVTA